MDEGAEDWVARCEIDSLEWLSYLRSSSRSRLIFRDMEVFSGMVSYGEFFLMTPTSEEASAAFASNECIAWFSECVDNSDHILDGRVDRVVSEGVKTVDTVNYWPGVLGSMGDIQGSIDIVEYGGLDIYVQIASLDTYSILDDFDDVDLLTMHTVLRRRCREFGFSQRLSDKRLQYLFAGLFSTGPPPYDDDDEPRGRHVANQMTKIYGNCFALGFTLDTLLEGLEERGHMLTNEDLARVWILENPNYTNVVQVAREIVGTELERLTGVDLLS